MTSAAEVRFEDRAELLPGFRRTTDGYLVGEVRCARAGCQEYRAAELGLDGDEPVTVYRPEHVVFDKASLATFAGKPITLLHPPEPVTADNWKSHAVGDVGTEIARDGEFVRVPVKLMDAGAIAAVLSGTREVSMGYTTGVAFEAGVAPDGTPYQAVQTGPIRINHLAIVPQARGGPELRFGDGSATARWGAFPIITDQENETMADAVKTRTITVDGLPVEVTEGAAAAIVKLQAALDDAEAKAKAVKAAADAELARRDVELAQRDAEIERLKKAALDDVALDRLVAERADLVARARLIDASVVTEGKSAAEIRRAVVTARYGDAMRDKSDAYIEAAFDILADGETREPGVRAALGHIALTRAEVVDRGTTFDAYAQSLRDAWKAPITGAKEH